MDLITALKKEKRNMEVRTTTANKDKLIKQMNKNAQDYGFEKISKNASVKDVERFKKEYTQRLTYDIVTTAIQEGKYITAEIEGRDLKKSTDTAYNKLGTYAKQLSQAKYQSDKNLTKEQKEFLESGNQNIAGYGNFNVMSMFEKAKTKKQIEGVINNLKTQNPNEIFYNKQIDVFEKVFQKVEIVRENDLDKVKEHLKNMSMEKAIEYTNYLLKTLEVYGSPDNRLGAWDDETELANARLDDVLIQLGEKKTGHRKVQKVLDKYKSNNKTNGYIY